MKKKGFTLIELMVVILIVGILAAASIPLMRGRIDSAKWAEANAISGTIQSASRVYYAEHGNTTSDFTEMGFDAGDLTGTYFASGDFAVSTDASSATTGKVLVTATSDGSGNKPAAGSYVLGTDGTWTKQ